MGWLSKKWKSLKKTVKKIGKKVKGAFAKVGAAFGKLGILGQIGLMFLMPYATGALSSFFGASGTLSGWATGLMKSANIGSQALGHGLNMVQKAASFAGKVYTTVSDTIGNAVDRVGNAATGKGFTLSADRTSVFAQGNERSLFSKKIDPTTIKPKSILSADDYIKNVEFDTKLKADTTKFDKILNKDLGGVQSSTNKEGYLKSYFEKDFTDASSFVKDKVVEGAVDDTSLLTKVLDIPGNVVDRVKGVSTDDIVDFGKQQVTDMVIGGSKQAGTQKIAEKLGYKQITPVSYNINLDNAMGNSSYSSVFNSIDYMTQPSGNNYYTSNVANSNYLNDVFMPNSPSYQEWMSQMSAGFYAQEAGK